MRESRESSAVIAIVDDDLSVRKACKRAIMADRNHSATRLAGSVHKFAQDRDEILWAATTSGLWRFCVGLVLIDRPVYAWSGRAACVKDGSPFPDRGASWRCFAN